MLDERLVIQKVLKGDLHAFGQLVTQYEKLVFSVLNRLIGSKADVSDLSQDVFIKIFKGLSAFKYEAKLSTWIAKIAHRAGLTYLEKRGGKAINQYPEEVDEIRTSDEDPEAMMIGKDTRIYLTTLIEKLPLPYKTVLTLYHLQDFSYREIEYITGWPEGTVKGYLFRARKALKDKVEKYLIHDIA